ncbi:hypothetical protein I2I05_15515 [Hymenobacter sp. BT683]|uniref:DUF3108 domain-containing protein n=1 Tax=Hymenobacter jeongseonensis TaxID=2791027 RepID=A0ABS0IKA7_9BACT|nr:hypothetical protein [Hymenobacter jeongseonensis]MBF9238810.1 hypothetical protein [Hymenobacter jeongseonensis]
MAFAVGMLLAGAARAQPTSILLQLPRPAAVSELTFERAAADCTHPFGFSEGQSIEYQLLNTKGRATNTWRYRVLKISTDTVPRKKGIPVVVTRVQLKSGLYDLNNRVLQQQDLTHFCRNDTTFTDGMATINYENMKSFRNRRLAYTVTPLAWPNQPAAGSQLANGGVAVQVSSPMVAIAKVQTMISQRTVLAGPTRVTVPAGTFSCYAVESKREVSTTTRPDLILKNSGREVNYYDPVVGIVKTEFYDKNGKLVQTRVLTKR